MKKRLLVSFLALLITLTLSSNIFATEENLSFPFNADSGKYWQYVSDRVMGGDVRALYDPKKGLEIEEKFEAENVNAVPNVAPASVKACSAAL